MNPNHLTKNVRTQVVEAVEAQKQMMREKNAKGIQKAFENQEEITNFFNPFYEKIKQEIDNSFPAFIELCVLQYKYGFVGGYLGGATLNQEGSTVINIE